MFLGYSGRPRTDTIELKKAVARLKRQIEALEKAQKPVVRAFEKTREQDVVVPAPPEQARRKWFYGKGITSLREKLGLSKTDFARLAGVTANMVARWEKQDGKINLRPQTIQRLLVIRSMGRRKAAQALGQQPAKTGATVAG